jgi:hypothetical protein
MRNVRNLVERPQNIYAEPVEVSILSPSKYTKKNLRNLLHLRKSACRVATTNRAETESNRVETKSNRVETKSKSLETYYFYAIRFFFYAFLTFF